MSLTPAVGPPRHAARAGAATGVTLAAACCGHLAADGAVPAAGLLAAAGVLALPAWWLTRRERGWGRLAAALVAGQLAAHVVFTWSGVAAGAAHHHPGWLPADLMLLAHLLAAALAAAWLRRGERRAWAAARRAAVALHRTLSVLLDKPVRVPAAQTRVPHRNIAQRDRIPRPAVLRNVIILRGPPLGT